MAEFRIPFFKPSITEDDVEAVAGALRSGWLTSGPNLAAFERELAEYCGVEHVNVVNSCTAALHLALRGWGIGPGDEVITTPYTFAATATVIVHTGATPVFADVREEDANIDPETIAAAVTPRTRAILPVHIGGNPCDMDAIVDIGARSGAKILEDAAHAIGSEYNGRKIGTVGDAAAFSFYATKNMTTGEGGALATNDSGLTEKVRTLTLHGMSRDAWKRYDAGASWRYDITEFGFKDNLSDMAAALGRRQLARIDDMTTERTRVAKRYISNLADEERLVLPGASPGHRQAWHLFAVRVKDEAGATREDVIRGLAEAGIQTSVHFIPVHTFSAYKELGRWKEGDFPVAERIFRGTVSLPIFPSMTDAEVDEVCDALRTVLSGS